MPLAINFDVQFSDVSVGMLIGVGICSCVAVASRMARWRLLPMSRCPNSIVRCPKCGGHCVPYEATGGNPRLTLKIYKSNFECQSCRVRYMLIEKSKDVSLYVLANEDSTKEVETKPPKVRPVRIFLIKCVERNTDNHVRISNNNPHFSASRWKFAAKSTKIRWTWCSNLQRQSKTLTNWLATHAKLHEH